MRLMDLGDLGQRLGIPAGPLADLIGKLAADATLEQEVRSRVNWERCGGRPVNHAGDDLVQPPPLKVRYLKDFAGRHAGQESEVAYQEAVSLINERLAVIV